MNTNDAAAGCFACLRRLLSKNLDHPAVPHGDIGQFDEEQKKPAPAPPSPGLVARLMGLETMPVEPYSATTPAAESIRRSRSTNSIDGWSGFLSRQSNWGTGARRRITSQSFREEPTFFRKESEEFLVLSFAPEEFDISSNGAKSKIDYGETKDPKKCRRNEERIEGKENAIGKKKKSQNRREINKSKPLQEKGLQRRVRKEQQREEPRRAISTNRKRAPSARAKKPESECSSQNSSPVSVLDRHADIDSESVTSPESPISEEEKKPADQVKPRRKLSSDLKADSYPTPTVALDQSSRRSKRTERREQERFSDTWAKICRLAEEDAKRCCWDFREIWRGEDNAEIIEEFGQMILDSLLHEVLTELI